MLGPAMVSRIPKRLTSAPYFWVIRPARANSAAGYELATGDPVMAIGGFNGTDPATELHSDDGRRNHVYDLATPIAA